LGDGDLGKGSYQPSGAGSSLELTREDTLAGNARDPAVGLSASIPRGTNIGRYVVLNYLGQGGMGVVLAAYDPDLDRKVALKLLRGSTGGPESSASTRLIREAQALAQVSHPNVVAIHDVGIHEGRVFVAMDFLAGPTFRQRFEAERLPWKEALALYRAAGEGLHAAHSAGLVHRDFKPDNVIIAGGRPRVLDFGLARSSLDTRPWPALGDTGEITGDSLGSDTPMSTGSGSRLGVSVTRAGAIMGTPAYMSPEQHLGETAGPASDQFSFCVGLYEALYGESPFGGASPAARALAVTQGEVRAPPKGTKVPSWLHKVMLRGLARSPDERWASMRELLDALADDPLRRRRRRVARAGVVAGLVGALAWAFMAKDEDPCPDPKSALIDARAWSTDLSRQIERAFLDSGVSFARDAAESVLADLDAYAISWAGSYRETCEATRVRHEMSESAMDLQMACLDDARTRLAAWTEVLAHADAEVVENARQSRLRLPDVAACADLDALGRRVSLPDDAASRRALDDAKALVAEASAVQVTGDLHRASSLLEEALTGAESVDYPPLVAEIQLMRAQLFEHFAEHEKAREAAAAGMLAAEAGRDRRLMAELRILYAMIVGDRLSRTDEGMTWIALAGTTVASLEGDGRLEARRLSHLALIESAAGNYKAELAAKVHALEILERLEGVDPVELAGVHNNLSSSLSQASRHDEALEHAQEALRLWTEALGERHPRTAIAWASLGLVHDGRGDYDKALTLHEKSVQILTEALGPDSPRLDEVRNNLAITAINLGDLSRGESIFRAIVSAHESRHGADSVEVGKSLGNLGAVLRMQDKFEESLEVQLRAVQIFERRLGPAHPRSTATMGGLANAYEKLGELPKAIELREKVLRIEQKAYGVDAPKVAIGVGNLAWSLLELPPESARPERARELSELALSIAENHELTPDVEAFLRLVRAGALVSVGGKKARAEADALVDQAEAVLGELPANTEREMIAQLRQQLN
jgi:serine/threonine protein kinase